MAKSSEVWVISIGEAQELSTRFCNYASHFQTSVDPKTRDLVLLLMALAIVELTRAAKYAAELKRKKRERAEAAAMAQPGLAMADNVVGLNAG